MNDVPLQDRYGGFFRTRGKLELSVERVPSNLLPFVEWAAYWGVSDDIDREKLRDEAPAEAIDDLREVIAKIDDDLNAWLAGPAAEEPYPTQEYIAFSAMRMVSL